MKQLMTIAEAARVLAISESHAYSLAKEGLLPVVRVGRRVRVNPADLERFIAEGGRNLPGGWRREPDLDPAREAATQ